jgi:3-oxoadipate enol-lactonase/4-carboxymuconolactone decarboxylase
MTPENPDTAPENLSDRERHARGMAVRRAVLSDAHVDRATASASEFTEHWQDFITRVAWGEVWSRPGLDRRQRSIAVLSSLIALGHHEEFAMHVRAARRNGLTVDEIGEVILQSAIYAGVPAANNAFRIAEEALAQDDGDAEVGEAEPVGDAETAGES